MLRVGFARVRPEKEQRLRAWLAELSRRLDEVLESFARETTRHEQVFIVLGQDGPLLVYVIEAGDMSTRRTHTRTLRWQSTRNIEPFWKNACWSDCALIRCSSVRFKLFAKMRPNLNISRADSRGIG